MGLFERNSYLQAILVRYILANCKSNLEMSAFSNLEMSAV